MHEKLQKLTISAVVMAIYVVVMYLTQSFSFGAYQVRLATALYALSYLLPYLVFPLALSNMLSNILMGGLGVFDIVGGFAVGLLTAGCCYLLRRLRAPFWLTAFPVILIPGLGVACWLAPLLGLPYWLMACNLLVGQLIPGLLGTVLSRALKGKLS